MTEPNDVRSASETTSLLGACPSPHSTDSPTPRSYSSELLPLASSYEDLRQSVELHLKDLDHASLSKVDAVIPHKRALNRQHAIIILLFGCALSALLLVALNFKPRTLPGNNLGPVDSSRAFSLLDPVHDLLLPSYIRDPETGPPKHLFAEKPDFESSVHRPYPTNAWYQNLLMLRGEPSNVHRVYSVPYLLDVVGYIPGLRAHANHILASTSVLQLTFMEEFGLTLGAAEDFSKTTSQKGLSHQYTILETTELGLTLKWNVMNMTSTIVKGMPYTTMEYFERSTRSETGEKILPTISSPVGLAHAPIVDSNSKLDCTGTGTSALVEKELELRFLESDYTWLVFFSEPVTVRCYSPGRTIIQVVGHKSEDSPLIVRAALLNSCTTSNNCRIGLGDRLPEENQVTEYASILRSRAAFYPGRATSVSYKIEDGAEIADLILDWDVKVIPGLLDESAVQKRSLRQLDEALHEPSLIMFGLPHHLDTFGPSRRPDGVNYCRSSLNGPTCLVEGATWTLKEDLPVIGLQAPRPPRAEYLPSLSEALVHDMNYSLPKFFERGAGDTYFSGKMLSKLARILLIAEELVAICEGNQAMAKTSDYRVACKNVTLPTEDEQSRALDRLRRSVEIWINGTAETPFVYDEAWGGVVSCGCLFNGKTCDNHYPDCPTFSDQGLDFGNGFYNDHHFHYGYHIHAAAVVAHFDHDWGKKHFEQVLLLVRDFANPSKDDKAFPLFRHKDWYQGSSWASGVPRPPYLNGKNQESSSEAIAAYESVALFGQVMTKIWGMSHDHEKMAISQDMLKVGQLLTATEIRSAQKYWHIKLNNRTEAMVPKEYTNNVVGMVWSTMIQFGTWFGAAPYLPYGIQLLPLTPISEARDELDWVNEMYYPFSRACADFHQCTESGWAILQLAILATVGYPEEAAARVKELLPDSYENAGGNGQSKSNTLWYIATRPIVKNPVPIDQSDVRGSNETRPAPIFVLSDCHKPETCTADVLDRKAGAYTCRERITWLITSVGSSQWEACSTVGGEYQDSCGPCVPGPEVPSNETSTQSPTIPAENSKDSLQCEPCTVEQCNSDLNRCPAFDRTFVCTHGPSKGGCSNSEWTLRHDQCTSCCEMTTCQKLKDEEAKKVTKDGNPLDPPKCPPCKPSICYGKVNQCPLHTAPYICLEGFSVGGCSATPWDTNSDIGQCTECCEITVTC